MTEIPHIDVATLAAQRDEVQLVDVRNPDEYDAGHVPGAQLLPLPELPDRLDELPDGKLHLICRSGGRSLKAAEFLAERGRDVVNVAGGTLAWVEAGEAVDTGSPTGGSS